MSDTTDLRGYTWPPISDAIDAPDSGVVASSLAVSKVNTKADNAMAQAVANIVNLSSSLDSTSEEEAATSLAVKTLKDLLDDVAIINATNEPLPNTIMCRDGAGRVRVEDPAYPNEVVNKRHMDSRMDSLTDSLTNSLGKIDRQVFTTTGTYTAPFAGLVFAILVGGGQGGAKGSTSSGAGGGRGKVTFTEFYPVYAGQQLAVTIGAGGAGSTSGAGRAGGNTSFAHFLAYGGPNGSDHFSPSTMWGASGSGNNGGEGGFVPIPEYMPPNAPSAPTASAGSSSGGHGWGAGGGGSGGEKIGGAGAQGIAIIITIKRELT